MSKVSCEQQARDMIERAGWKDAQSATAGDVVEIANLINERPRDYLSQGGVMLESLEKLLTMVESEQMDEGDAVAIGQDSYFSAELLLLARVELDTIRVQ